MKKLKNWRNLPFFLIVILFLALILRLVNLDQSFWLDEAAQVIESSRPLSQQFNLAADFHPPLYHLFLHFWLNLGKSEAIIRIPSVLFGVLSVFIVYQIGYILNKRRAGLIASLFLAVSPYHIWYSQEARPYSLFVFLSSLLTFLWIKKKWRFYTIVAILLLYAHYFAPFVFLSHLVATYAIDKKSLKRLVFSLFLSLIAFLPWLPSFFNQLQIGTSGFFTGWTSIVSVDPVKTVPLTFAKFIFGKGSIDNNFVYSLVILPIFLIFLYGIFLMNKSSLVKLLQVLFFVPFLIIFIISYIFPIIAPQRLIFLLPIFLLILGFVIASQTKYVEKFLIFVVLITFLMGNFQYYFDPTVSREQWRQAVAFVENVSSKDSLVLFVFPEPFAPFLWYNKGRIDALGIASDFIVKDQDLNRLNIKFKNKNQVYLFDYLTGLTDPRGKTKDYLLIKGYKQSATYNFPGVGFIHHYVK